MSVRATTASAGIEAWARPRVARCVSARPARDRRPSSTSSAASPRSRTRSSRTSCSSAPTARRCSSSPTWSTTSTCASRTSSGPRSTFPTRPRRILLWQALDGGPLPVFAHVPLLVNEKRQKLSKRRDTVALEHYRDEGYLPEAMRNYLMLLGWAPPGDRRDRAVRGASSTCSGSRTCNSSPAFFDVKKLDGVQRRVHPGAVGRRVRRARAAVARAAARAVARRAVRSRRVRGDGAARAGAGHAAGRGAGDRRLLVPRGTAARRPASWDKAMKAPDAATILRRCDRGLRRRAAGRRRR